MTENTELQYFEYWFENERDYISAYSMFQADNIYCSEILRFTEEPQREVSRKIISKNQAQDLGLELMLNFNTPGVIARLKV